MTTPREAYDQLIEHFKKTSVLGSCAAVLGWDKETYMPPKGNAHRAEQLALISGMRHERATDPKVGEWISACEGTELTEDPLSVEAVNLREWRRGYNKSTKVPQRLVEELARTTTQAHHEWVEARKESDFKRFQPWLEKLLGLKKEQAEAVGYEENIYDALLDDYEPGEKASNIATVFSELQKDLVPYIQKIAGASKKPKSEILKRSYPIDRQKIFGQAAASAIGFDFEGGRLDVVVHPFCTTIGPGDTRLTTRYYENNFAEGLTGILHEAGHGLYGQGLPKEHYGSPMGNAVSLGIHESQSLIWENYVGRNPSFWTYLYPLAKGTFHEALVDVSQEEFVHAINEVEPGYIRVQADKATYNLHIVLRFEIEQDLLSGNLAVGDLPGAWNEKFEKMLGLKVGDDALGCLQDTHWSIGAIGYFPTYCLGNLYSAQLFEQACKDIPDLEEGFTRGHFKPLLDWLREKVHSQAMRYYSNDLAKNITGEGLSHKPLMRHLEQKIAPMYGL